MLIFLFVLFLGLPAFADERPNFVVIYTDDQDVVLGGMEPMTNVRRLIADEGITYANSFVTCPICCPSRASMLTGLYLHNHQAFNNSQSGGCYSPYWRENEERVFANKLYNAGYKTFYAGKYLNEYGFEDAGGPERVPPGWTEWHGLVGNSVFYNYTLSNNGVAARSTNLYLTDVLRDFSVNFLDNLEGSDPFLMVIATPAAHSPFEPAPRHEGVYSNVTAPRTPNFNIAVDDKHWLMRMPPSPLPDSMMPELDRVYRARWETLLAVDEMVADILETLYNRSLMENTYIIYTSDHGYHVGQFSQVYDKRQPYEADIRVPLVIRGPGLKKNVINENPILNIDLAPTILELAGVEAKDLDGQPIELFKEELEERYMLIEYNGEGIDLSVESTCPWAVESENFAFCSEIFSCKCQDTRNNTYACVRHLAKETNMKYCVFEDDANFVEMYDLSSDPFELKNIINEESQSTITKYDSWLAHLLKCKGAEECSQI